MKIAMLSDFHLGYDRFREDARKQAEEALELASQVSDVILIPGDIFDFRHPSPDVLAEAINIFRNLAAKKWRARVSSFDGDGRAYTSVPIIAIPGTHERRAEGVEDPVDLLGLAGLLVDISKARVVIEMDGERIAVLGIGGIADERFRDVVKEMDPKPIEGMFNVLMFHQSVYELLPFSDDFIKADELPKGFDLYVNGHIHSKVEEKVHGKPFLISGSTVLTQLKAAEQDLKGFFVYDTVSKSYAYNKINCRKFVIEKIDIGGLDPSEAGVRIKERIAAIADPRTMPIIRVELSGKLKKGSRRIDLDTAGIAKSFSKGAIVEIGREGESVLEERELDPAKALNLEGTSIRDYGLSIFIERLKHNNYSLDVSASELFDILSADTTKDKAVKAALERLFDKN